MECTQRLECTQDLYSTQSERIYPEQIGFLGICGTKYPVKKGPNKIGRDPQTCNIVLNLNSVSRQHAVINVLNKKEFMLMDLDSANKTKLIDKTLQPYIPHPLKNGDTLQFGQVFGIFRLLEDENDLPMTQAIDIPETPVSSKFVSRINNGTVMNIPESPDVSDKDDSYIVASQPKSSNNNFLKPKIENFWKSSKKSNSLQQFDDSNSFNDSTLSCKTSGVTCDLKKDKTVHELETQVPREENNYFVHTAETQEPNNDVPSIHSFETQVPIMESQSLTNQCSINNLETQVPDVLLNSSKTNLSPSIHSLETQIPYPETNDLSPVDDINTQSIYGLDTQLPNFKTSPEIKTSTTSVTDKDDSIFDALTQAYPAEISDLDKSVSIVDNIMSNQEKISEELEMQPFEELNDCEGKKLSEKNRLTPLPNDDINILPTQNIATKDDEDVTDCEDDIFSDDDTVKNVISNVPTQVIPSAENEKIDLQDMLTQVIEEDYGKNKEKNYNDFDDLLTQKIDEVDDVISNFSTKEKNTSHEDNFGDLLTQKIDEDNSDYSTNIIKETVCNPIKKQSLAPTVNESPFKIPFSVNKAKKKLKTEELPLKADASSDGVDKYYADTQDLMEDLCSQKVISENEHIQSISHNQKLTKVNLGADDDFFVQKISQIKNKSPTISNDEEKVRNSVSSLCNDEIKDPEVASLTKVPSDPSDVELTPKKIRPLKFMNIDLPNSQEIKTSVSLASKSVVTESSSDSEIEQQDSEECTPILFKKKKRVRKEAKLDLSKKFDIESLPTRVITRQRKPTAKIQDNVEHAKVSRSILKSKLLSDQEDVDKDIINENLTRLRNRTKHSKNDTIKNIVEKSQEPEILIVEKRKEPEILKNEIDIINHLTGDKSKLEEKKPRGKKEKKEKEKDDKEKNNKENNAKKKSEKEKNYKEKRDAKSKDSIRKYLVKKSTKIEIIDLISVKNNNETQTHDSSNETKTMRTRRQKSDSQKDDIISIPTMTKKTKKEEKIQKDPKVDSQSLEPITTRRKRATRREIPVLIEDSSPEVEIRRSKRQRNVKDKSEVVSKKEVVKREQSTIYNLSSESGIDSPKNLKRSFTCDAEVPSAKRSRTVASLSNNSSIRSTPSRAGKIQYVLFTAFPSEEVKLKLEKLGAVVVTDVTKCTVLLTLQIKRTFKLLCAVGLGVPIVGASWVQACADANMLVDPWQYIIKDEAAEKRFTFSLEKTLNGKRNFLKGFNISSTTNVMPAAAEMKLIVESSGGEWKNEGPNWICVSCVADKPLWPSLRRKGAIVVSTEFILGGVLRQKPDVQANTFK